MPTNVAFLSDRLTADHIAALHRAQLLIEWDPLWPAWVEEVGLRDVSSFSYLEVGDRDKVYRGVRGDNLSYKVDAGRIVEADNESRLVAEWLAIHGEMFDYWAKKKCTTSPPPLPDPDGMLPPHIEEGLAAMRADQVVEAAYDDWFAELIDQDD